MDVCVVCVVIIVMNVCAIDVCVCARGFPFIGNGVRMFVSMCSEFVQATVQIFRLNKIENYNRHD